MSFGYLKISHHKRNFKYQSWYLTPCCGLEEQKLTQALQSIKGAGTTFD
jgi:hypothetical protein